MQVKDGLNKSLQKDPRFRGQFTKKEFERIAQRGTEALAEPSKGQLQVLASGSEREQVTTQGLLTADAITRLQENRNKLSDSDQRLLDRVIAVLCLPCPGEGKPCTRLSLPATE